MKTFTVPGMTFKGHSGSSAMSLDSEGNNSFDRSPRLPVSLPL